MKKQDQKRLEEALDKALAPPRQRPKHNLDALLDEYDDEQPIAASQPSAPIAIPTSIPTAIPIEQKGIPDTIPTGIPTSIPNKTRPKKENKPSPEGEETPEAFTPLDATHTSAERDVYSIMYRETISKGISERHFGPAELMKKSGIRSRNTVHKALYGLIEKLSIEVISEALGNPLGPRYKVYKPQTIEQRRKAAGIKIDQQTKRITERGGIPASIPEGSPPAITKNWDTTLPSVGIPAIPNSGTLLNKENNLEVESVSPSSSSNLQGRDDDEATALSDLNALLSEAARTLTGRAPRAGEREQWAELARVLVEELNEAAARAGSVSSVPAFLAAHLRRKLAPKPATRKREGNQPSAATPLATPADLNRRLTQEEIADLARTINELLRDEGYTLARAEEQFAASMRPEDWTAVVGRIKTD